VISLPLPVQLYLYSNPILLLGLGDMATKIGLTPDSSTIQRLLFLGSYITYTHPLTSAFSAVILLVLVRSHRHRVVVIASIAVSRMGRLDQAGLDVLGQVGGISTFL
jgi:hypothetical protein